MPISHPERSLFLPTPTGPPAATFNIVFDNAAFDDDYVVTDKLGFLNEDYRGDVTAYLDTTAFVQDNAASERGGSLPHEPRDFLVLLRRALCQGLNFTLRGAGLMDVLGQSSGAMRFLLASSRLTNLHGFKETSWDNVRDLKTSGRSISFNSIRQEGASSDVNVNDSGVPGNLDQSTAQQEYCCNSYPSTTDDNVITAIEEQRLGSRITPPDNSKADISSFPCEIMLNPAVNSNYTVKSWCFDHSLGQNQVNREVFLSSALQKFGNNGQSHVCTTAVNENTSLVLEPISPVITQTNVGVHVCDSFESINKIGPENCKQKTMSMMSHMHGTKVPSLSEEHYMSPQRNVVPLWPALESQCSHIQHFPQRSSRNLLSQAAAECSKSTPEFRDSCPGHPVYHPWSHSSPQKYEPEKSFQYFHQDNLLKCRSNHVAHCYSTIAQSPPNPFPCDRRDSCFYQKNFLEKEMPSCSSPSSLGCFTSYDEFHGSASECQFQNYSSSPSSLAHEHTGICQGHPSKLKSRKLLWVSEEEAEIIRLIRLSQDINRSSSPFCTSRQDSPILKMKVGPEIPEDINLNEQKDKLQITSACSSSFMEDYFSKHTEDGIVCMDDLDKKPELVGSDDQILSLNCGKLSSSHDYEINMQKNAASCIQYFWRKHLERKEQNKEEKKRLEALNFVSEVPAGHDCLMQMAITAMKSGHLVSWHSSMLKATKTIQRAWRELLRRRHDQTVAPQSLPGDMKELYEFIATRHISKGRTAPYYEKFIKCMKRLQAATEGARIRRRLKSRRLQTIVKEIKEIKLVVQELSNEPTSESSPNLLPQLSIQLQQKMLQLHTALSGTQDAARVLLRRCPATPIVIGSSKTLQTETTALKSPTITDARSSGNLSVKSSTENIASPQKKKPAQIANLYNNESESSQSYGLISKADNKASFTVSRSESSLHKACQRQTIVRNEEVNDVSHVGRKEHVSKHLVGISSSKSNCKNLNVTNRIQKTEQVTEQLQNETKSVNAKSSLNAGCISIDHSDDDNGSHNLDVPRHPFLRRKSKAMPPQKLDWSKVKPMVSSRLEPELKTRLHKTKFRGTSLLRKKRNFSETKSRLFSYEKTITEEASGLVKRESENKIDNRTTLSDHDSKEGQMPANKSSEVKNSKRPSLRYFQNHGQSKADDITVCEPKSQQGVPVPCLNKINSRHDNSSYFSLDSSFEDTRLTKADIHQRKSRYSNRYSSSDEWANEQVLVTATNTLHSENIKNDNSASFRPELASPELEKTFESVIIAKKDGGISLAKFFPSNQVKHDSVVPRFHPGSSLFKLQRHEMSRIHEFLSKQGSAGRLQHNCLS